MCEIIEFKPKEERKKKRDDWNVKRDGWEKFDTLAKYYGVSRKRMLDVLAEGFLKAYTEHPKSVRWPPRFDYWDGGKWRLDKS